MEDHKDTLSCNKELAAKLGADIPQGLKDERVVTVPRLNVRSGPGVSYNWIRYLQLGDKVNVISEEDGWAKISSFEYVFADYLKPV